MNEGGKGVRFEELFELNPWWQDPKSIAADRHVVLYEGKKYKYYPDKILRQIELDRPGIYTLRGPRQIGKTSTVKLLIRELIDGGVDPKKIVYLPCDNVKDRFELVDLLTRYVRVFVQDKKFYLFVDEATMVSDWQLAVKHLVDSGLFDEAVMIITGSSAYDLKVSTERLPGRRGAGKDLVYLPLTFREYLKGFGVQIEALSIIDLLNLSQAELEDLQAKCSFVKKYFDMYWLTGGFPFVVNDFLERGFVSDDSMRTITDFVLGDMERYTRSRLRIVEMMKKLPDVLGQRFSWNSLIDSMENFAESPMTVQKYFEFFCYLFILVLVYFVDPSTGNMKVKKQKKVYPIDTIVLKIVEKMGNKRVDEGHIAEMITLRHLIDESKLQNGLNLYEGPFYWYSEKGKEIDFLIERGGLIPVEVKYQNRISRSDYSTMLRVFKKGVLVTKDTVFKDGTIVGIPLWLFSALA